MHPTIRRADPMHCAAILALQKLAYQSEARLYSDWGIPPLTETLEELRAEFAQSLVLIANIDGEIVGSVRAKANGGTIQIGRLVVQPNRQGQGIGSALLRQVEYDYPSAIRFELFTGSKSEANIRLYAKHGYEVFAQKQLSPAVSLVFMFKRGKGVA